MRKVFPLIALAGLVLLLAAHAAVAHDFWGNWTDRPWERGDPGSTYQHWDFSLPSTTGQYSQPTEFANPYGIPSIQAGSPTYPDIVPGPDGVDIPTLHLGDYDPSTLDPNPLTIWIPNQPVENWVKLVYIQITSDKYTLNNAAPTVITSSGTGAAGISSPGPIIKHGPTSWYTYNWLIEIHPNPLWEQITFTFPGSTNISQIVVDTICTDVPEPGSFAVLGSGILGGALLIVRRRRL